MSWACPRRGHAAVNDIEIIEGGTLDPAVPRGIVVEQHMAAHFDFEVGDTFEISTPDGWAEVEVLGVAASPEYLWPARSRQEVLVLPDDFGVVFAPEAARGRRWHPTPSGTRSSSAWPTTPPARPWRRLARPCSPLGALDAYTLDEQPSNAALQEDVAGFAEMSVMFPAFFLIAAAFATYVMLGRMIAGQTANIGTLRASGFKSRTILWHYAAIGVGVGLVASIIGVILGALLAEAITRLYTGVLSIPAAVVDIRPSTIAHRLPRPASPPASWPPTSRRASAGRISPGGRHARPAATRWRRRVPPRAAHPAAARPAGALALGHPWPGPGAPSQRRRRSSA